MRVLVIEDEEMDYRVIKRLFTTSYPDEDHEFTWIQYPDLPDVSSKLNDCDLCFIDQNLGTTTGLDLLRGAGASKLSIPVILLTGYDDEAVDEQAALNGASDYITKGDLTASFLKRSIRYSLARKENEQALSKLAFTDGLTGLDNRIKFDQSLRFSLKMTLRSGDYLALVLIDLDDFKVINDTFGHAAGDMLLVEFSRRLKKLVRQSDVVGRLGGDEFGIIINGYQKQSDIHVLMEKILSIFEDPLTYGEETFYGQGSLGVAILAPGEEPRNSSELTRAADGALYRAKSLGKNNIVYYDQKLGETIQQTASMESALTRAVENGELELYFQPKVNSQTRKLSGAEALLRWHWGSTETISPDIFIPVTERSLSILDIGKWVIEETCRKMQSWSQKGLILIPIAINISPVQLQSSTFVEHMEQTMEQYKIDPSLIELEITETALMAHVNKITDRMAAMADIGCKWVIDDFGIGHSSLSRLADLPITKIKLDQSFVQQAPTSEANQKICSIIALLAHELDVGLVAEGVETDQQIEALTLLPDDELQGFHFSKPLPVADFEKWLATDHQPAHLRT